MAFLCPHCGSSMNTRSSNMTTPLTREVYYQCQNVNCGHTAYGVTELIRTITPPNFPNPAVKLPVVKPEDARDPNRKTDSQQELFS